VEFLYSHLTSATLPGNVLTSAALAPPQNDLTVGVARVHDENNLAVTLRMHKDFLP
jgi:hypothetical protein